MLTTHLAYVALVVRAPEATAALFQRDFGLARTDCTIGETSSRAPVLRIGASALALFAPGDAFVEEAARLGVHHIALAAPDPWSVAATAAEAGIDVTELPRRDGLNGSRRLRLDAQATAGVRTYLVEPLEIASSGHGLVERIDHLGVASADNHAAIDVFAHRLGFPVESTETDMEVQMAVESFTSDKYGVVYHNRAPQPVGGLRVAFMTIGDCELEFLQDFDPRPEGYVAHGQAGTTRQDRGAIARFVTSHGAGLHHLAIKVEDINAALAALQQAGHTMIDRAGRPGGRRSLIGFVHPKSFNGLLVHLVQREEIAPMA
ncbi:MAG: VOC family protein [Candidatus Tectomicrobia bacterium]